MIVSDTQTIEAIVYQSLATTRIKPENAANMNNTASIRATP